MFSSVACLHGQARYCTACSPTISGVGVSVSQHSTTRETVSLRDAGAIDRVVRNLCRDLTSSELFGLSPDDVADIAASDLPAFLKLGLLSYLWASRGSVAQAISAADAQTDLLRVGRAASSVQSVQVLVAAVLACLSVARLCRNEDVAVATYLGRRIAAVDALRAVIGDVATWAAEWRDDVRSAERVGVDAALRLAADALLWAALDAVTELQHDARQGPAVGALLRVIIRIEDVVPGAAAAPRAAATLLLAEDELFALSGAPQGSALEASKLHAAAALLSRCVGLLVQHPPHHDAAANEIAAPSSVWHALLGACVTALRTAPIGGPPQQLPSPHLVGARLSDVLLQLGRAAQAVDVWFRLVAAPSDAPASAPALRDGFAEVLGVLELAALLPYDDPSLGALTARGWEIACILADRALLEGGRSQSLQAGDEPDLLLADASMAALRRRCAAGNERSAQLQCLSPRSICQAAIASAGGVGGAAACGLSVHLALQMLAAVALYRGDALSAVGRHRAASHWFGRALFASLHLHQGCPHQLCSSAARGPLQVRTWVAACRFVSACIRSGRFRAASRASCLLLAAAGPHVKAGQHWSAVLPAEVAGVLRVQGVLIAAAEAASIAPTAPRPSVLEVAVQASIDDMLAGDGVTLPSVGPAAPLQASVLSYSAARRSQPRPQYQQSEPDSDTELPQVAFLRSPPRSARRGVGASDPLQSEIDWLLLRANEAGQEGDVGLRSQAGDDRETDGSAPFQTPAATPRSSVGASFASPGIVQAYRTAAALAGGAERAVVGAATDAVGIAGESLQRPPFLPEWSPAPSGKPPGHALNISALDEDVSLHGGPEAEWQQRPIFADELESAADRSSVANVGVAPPGVPVDRAPPVSRVTLSAWAGTALGSDTLSPSELVAGSFIALNMLGVALELANSAPATSGGASSAQAALAAVAAAASGFVTLLKQLQPVDATAFVVEPGRFRVHELLSLTPWGGAVGAAALLPWRNGARAAATQPYGVAAALHWVLPGIARYPPDTPLLADVAGAAQWVAAGPSEPILLAAATFEVNKGAAFAATLGQRLSAPLPSSSEDVGEAFSASSGGDLAATLAATLRGAGPSGSPRLTATISSPSRECFATLNRAAASGSRAGGTGGGSPGRSGVGGAFSPHASRRGAPSFAPTIGAATASGYAPTTPPRARGGAVPAGGSAVLQSPGKRGPLLEALRAVTAGSATWAALGRQWSAIASKGAAPTAADSEASSRLGGAAGGRGDAVADLEVLRANRVQSMLRRAMQPY